MRITIFKTLQSVSSYLTQRS